MSDTPAVFIPAQPIRASATVEQILGGSVPTFEVSVWGEPPHDCRRTYTIKAQNDNVAAFEGINLFVQEMCNLDGADLGAD